MSFTPASIWRGIRSDLRSTLLAIPGIPDVRWESKGAIYHIDGSPATPEPAAGVPFIRERLSKGGSTTETLGSAGMSQEEGIYMLDLYWPTSGIMHEGEDLADKIRLSFYHGRDVSASGQAIKGAVRSSNARDMIEGDAWLIFPLRIEFWFRRYTRQAAA